MLRDFWGLKYEFSERYLMLQCRAANMLACFAYIYAYMNLNYFEAECTEHMIIYEVILIMLHQKYILSFDHIYLANAFNIYCTSTTNQVFLGSFFFPKYHVFTIHTLGTPVKSLFLSLFHPLDVAGTAFVSWYFQFLVSSQL